MLTAFTVPTSKDTTQTAWCWDSENWPCGLGQAQLHPQHEVRLDSRVGGWLIHSLWLKGSHSPPDSNLRLPVYGRTAWRLPAGPWEWGETGLQRCFPPPFQEWSRDLCSSRWRGLGGICFGKSKILETKSWVVWGWRWGSGWMQNSGWLNSVGFKLWWNDIARSPLQLG